MKSLKSLVIIGFLVAAMIGLAVFLFGIHWSLGLISLFVVIPLVLYLVVGLVGILFEKKINQLSDN